MDEDLDWQELGLGILVAGVSAALLSTVVPTAFALAAGLAAGLPFLAVGAGIADDTLETRLYTGAAAFAAGLVAAAVVVALAFPPDVQTPLVIGATYLVGSLVAVTR